ncbi:MAG: hypothetical protein KDC60_08295, partial [Bacteroidetes bacterium]|nr:hypothetical protein [Bacteroidota bacterium]
TQGDAYLVNGQLYVWTGSKWENVGNIQGPKGDKGEKGDVGANGQQGIQGIKGDKGDKGDVGATGPQGIQGIQGLKGDKGATGDKGNVGATGPQGIQGIKGEKGDIGATGPQGIQGVKGDKGDKGDSFANGTAINQMLVWNGTAWVVVAPPTEAEQTLVFNNGKIKWAMPLRSDLLPSITTKSVTNINFVAGTAIVGGIITDEGGSSVTLRGVCWDTLPFPTTQKKAVYISYTIKDFNTTMTGLIKGKTYYVRAFARNDAGTKYGQQEVFNGKVPLVMTNPITNITSFSAVASGNVTNDGGFPNAITRGFCWSTNPDPTISDFKIIASGNGTGSFSYSLTGLEANTTYYVRAYATNALGTGYGLEVSFKTTKLDISGKPYLNQSLDYGSVEDHNGNVYATIKIGNQVWMAENLNAGHYNDGTPIPYISDATNWKNLTTGAWVYYDKKPAYGVIYGKLYNGYVDYKKLCPKGWHIPINAEVELLAQNVGGLQTNLKSNSSLWKVGVPGTNSSGFSALPAGLRYSDGSFSSGGDIGAGASFYSVYNNNVQNMNQRYNIATQTNFLSPDPVSQGTGMSCRCVKD